MSAWGLFLVWLGAMVVIGLALTLLMAVPAKWAYGRDREDPPASPVNDPASPRRPGGPAST